MFASTSKITFAGAGVSVLAASAANKAWYLKHLAMAAIGPDKVNHLRHVEFFGDADGVRAHMRKHREIIAPKFEAVDAALTAELDGLGIAELDQADRRLLRQPRRPRRHAPPGSSQLAKEAGIALTPAGSAFPHGNDPHDRNIRLAPTFPSLADVETAMAGVATCASRWRRGEAHRLSRACDLQDRGDRGLRTCWACTGRQAPVPRPGPQYDGARPPSRATGASLDAAQAEPRPRP